MFINVEDLLIKVENTGLIGVGDKEEDFLYKHLVLSKEEYYFLDKNYEIDDFCTKNKIDFISIEKNGYIDFEHFSDVDNKEDIEEKGLILLENGCPDLGLGIYLVSQDNLSEGKDNLGDYYIDAPLDKKLLKVTGSYNGDFIECVYGYGHKGYIVVNRNIPPTDISIEIVTLEEEFY